MIKSRSSKIILAVGGFICLTLFSLLLRETLTLANFTMLYILLVLVIAIELGTYAATMAALVSFLSINFFLTQPYYTFFVFDSREVIDLIVFIVVAGLSGQLGAQARFQAQAAQQRTYEQEILYKLASMMNQANAAAEVSEALIKVMLEDLGAVQAYILPDDHPVTIQQNEKMLLLLLKAGENTYGTVCIIFNTQVTSQQKYLLGTCVTQAAMALQRIELGELARTSQQYEEADRLKTAILRAVSHDLRTPITVIKTSANNLKALGERLPPAERQEISQTIEQEADHLDKLVGNLLDLSRLQAGALTLNRDLNSFEEVVGDVAARIWQITGEERIHFHFPEHMPLFSFDYGLMLQTITNLVDNALRYEPPDSQIEISANLEDDFIAIRLINHGETISPGDHEQIMQPFFHGKDGHIGLGLPIAKGIIEAHRGTLTAEDTPGGGATFVLRLPYEPGEDTL